MRGRALFCIRGVLAMAAVALVAIAAFGSATAAAEPSVLCSANENRCSFANTYTGKLESTAETGAVVDFGEGKKSFCSSSTLNTEGELKNAVLAFSGCSEGCTVSSSYVYATELTATSGGNGKIVLKNGGSGQPTFVANCGSECKYSATTMELTMAGGAAPSASVLQSFPKVGGGLFCPSSLTLSAGYDFKAPKPGYMRVQVAPAPTKGTTLCLSAEEKCPEAARRALDLYAEVEGGVTLNTGGMEIGCTSGALGLESTASTGGALPGHAYELSLGTCAGGACKVTANTPYSVTLAGFGGGNGQLNLTRTGGVIFTITCFANCTYGTESLAMEVKGGTPAKVFVNANLVRVSGGFGCQPTGKITGTYSVKAPGSPLFVRTL